MRGHLEYLLELFPHILTVFSFLWIVASPREKFRLRDNILHRRGGQPRALLLAELHVPVECVLAKLPPAVVTSFVQVLGSFGLRLFLLNRSFRWRNFFNITFISPNFIDRIENFLGLSRYFFTYLFDNKMC